MGNFWYFEISCKLDILKIKKWKHQNMVFPKQGMIPGTASAAKWNWHSCQFHCFQWTAVGVCLMVCDSWAAPTWTVPGPGTQDFQTWGPSGSPCSPVPKQAAQGASWPGNLKTLGTSRISWLKLRFSCFPVSLLGSWEPNSGTQAPSSVTKAGSPGLVGLPQSYGPWKPWVAPLKWCA